MVEVGDDACRSDSSSSKCFTMDESFLNDLLECSVCLEQLDSSSKVLPCQHTFCKRCLQEIVNSHKELRCPECRILVDAKIEELPCNILLVRLLEGIKNNVQRPKRSSCIIESSTTARPGGGGPESSMRQTPPHPQLPQVSGSILSTTSDLRTVPKQVLQPCPCARALYPYEAKVPGDLTFRKGDIISLRKRVDQNWFYGELGGKSGFVPASFVQVVVPIATHVPQCKALYDFQISNSEEKDCLTFGKGDILTVIRRIDDHWAEGKLRERIGIFPISFVEMNASARAVMKLSTNIHPGSLSMLPPPAPSSNESRSVSAIPATTSNAVSLTSTCQDSSPAISSSLVVTSALSSPFSSSSAFTSPIHSIGSSGSHHHQPHPASGSNQHLPEGFGHMPSHESQPPTFNPIANQQRQPALPLFQSIAQITGGAHLDSCDETPSQQGLNESSTESSVGFRSRSTPSPGPVYTSVAAVTPPLVSQRSESMACPRNSLQNMDGGHPTSYIPSADGSSVCQTPLRSGSISQPTHVPVPHFYLALYSYRPTKEDELELRKGELYTVSEKCQDGWFKGTSLRTGHSGVFPGNYVQLAKSAIMQTTHMMTSPANQNPPSSSTSPPPANSGVSLQPRHVIEAETGHSIMPSLAPTIAFPNSSILYSGGRAPATSPSPVSLNHPAVSEWAQNVAAIAAPSQRLPRVINAAGVMPPGLYKSEAVPKNVPCGQSRSPSILPWPTDFNSVPSASPLVTEFPVRTTSASPTRMLSYQPSSCAVNTNSSLANNSEVIGQPRYCLSQPSTPLMTPHMASSTNPFIASASCTQAVSGCNFAPSSSATAAIGGVSVQARLDKHKDKKEKEIVSLMKRLTKRKSKSPPPSDFSCDNPTFVDASSSGQSLAAVHIRSTSCPSEALGSQGINHKKTSSFDGGGNNEAPRSSSRPKQPAPLVRERFRCIVPYPPNSDYELELKVGDVVYVHKKREDGWYKGTLQRTGKTGLFPSSFVEGF